MKESPGIHLNVAGKTITIQKKLLQAYEERINEQKKWIEVLASKVNALDKTYGAQYIWKIDHYSVEKLRIESICFDFVFNRIDYKKHVQAKKQH